MIVYPFMLSQPVVFIRSTPTLFKKLHNLALDTSKYLAASVKEENYFLSPVSLLVNRTGCCNILGDPLGILSLTKEGLFTEAEIV